MPSATSKTPAKRALAETSNARTNLQNSPHSAKKAKLDNGSALNGRPTKVANGGLNSSQLKSSFETEVLEKLSQDMTELQSKNNEREQPWERPSLDDFDHKKDNICFQQIDAEEGVLYGGKPTVKLFGVTEVIIDSTS